MNFTRAVRSAVTKAECLVSSATDRHVQKPNDFIFGLKVPGETSTPWIPGLQNGRGREHCSCTVELSPRAFSSSLSQSDDVSLCPCSLSICRPALPLLTEPQESDSASNPARSLNAGSVDQRRTPHARALLLGLWAGRQKKCHSDVRTFSLL
ncbi:hypothetical protein BKA80DRAFT_68443 [Phyllosticta citrichinensis]